MVAARARAFWLLPTPAPALMMNERGPSPRGKIYYVCGACCTAIDPDAWEEMDLGGGRPIRFYCGCCHHKFKVKNGMVIEITIASRKIYYKAEIPPSDLMGTLNRFTLNENYLPAFLNVEVWGRQFLTQAYRRETRQMINNVEDPRGPTIEVATPIAGHWKMDDTMYENLPKIMWSQLVNILEATHVQEERHRTWRGR